MNTWFVILLSVIVVCAIAVLLTMAVFGDKVNFIRKPKHRRGEYINDKTALIVDSITHTDDPAKAYQLFTDYTLTNFKQFLAFVSNSIRKISTHYNEGEYELLCNDIVKIDEMDVELKDQLAAQEVCLDSIDDGYYIETSVWLSVVNDARFFINRTLKRIAKVCIYYDENYDQPFTENYIEQLTSMVDDICSICDRAKVMLDVSDVEGMRDLRKHIKVVLSKSYDNASRLYDLLHDGKNKIDRDRKMALKFALNAMQECYCITYSLRYLVFCNIFITLSQRNR